MAICQKILSFYYIKLIGNKLNILTLSFFFFTNYKLHFYAFCVILVVYVTREYVDSN